MFGQATKSIWWMPWRQKAMKGVISCGEAQIARDPQIPEWGNPAGLIPCPPDTESIGFGQPTGGSETSQYPQEEKETSIPSVAASERGTA